MKLNSIPNKLKNQEKINFKKQILFVFHAKQKFFKKNLFKF